MFSVNDLRILNQCLGIWFLLTWRIAWSRTKLLLRAGNKPFYGGPTTKYLKLYRYSRVSAQYYSRMSKNLDGMFWNFAASYSITALWKNSHQKFDISAARQRYYFMRNEWKVDLVNKTVLEIGHLWPNTSLPFFKNVTGNGPQKTFVRCIWDCANVRFAFVFSLSEPQ